MVPIGRYVEAEVEHAVIAAKVIGPEEALLPQFDAGREEPEHGVQDRHLHQHGQAAARRVHTGLAVQVHGGLLFLQRIAILVLGGDHVHFGLQHAHLGTAHQVPVGEGHEQCFDHQGKHEDDHAVAPVPAIEEVEDGDHQPLVHPTEDPPAQVDDLIEVGNAGVLERAVVVGTEVDAHGHCGFRSAFLVEVQGGLVALGKGAIGERCYLQAAAVAGETGVVHHCHGEEILLEGHPVGTRDQVGGIGFGFADVVAVFVEILVVHAALLLFGGQVLLVVAPAEHPPEDDVAGVNHVLHPHHFGAGAHEMAVAVQRVGDAQEFGGIGGGGLQGHR